MGGVKNPDLLHRITVREFHQDPYTRDLQVVDSNHNGVVDHQDRVISPTIGEMDAEGVLRDMCEDRIPNDTAITATPQARTVVRAEGVGIRPQENRHGVRYDNLELKKGSVASYGGYDPTVFGCHYNQTGFHLEKGTDPHEVKASYTDATGDHQKLLNLQSGVIRPVKK